MIQRVTALALHFPPQLQRLVYCKHLSKCSQMVSSLAAFSVPTEYFLIIREAQSRRTPARNRERADGRKYFQYITERLIGKE